jgi:hypothetical protein
MSDKPDKDQITINRLVKRLGTARVLAMVYAAWEPPMGAPRKPQHWKDDFYLIQAAELVEQGVEPGKAIIKVTNEKGGSGIYKRLLPRYKERKDFYHHCVKVGREADALARVAVLDIAVLDKLAPHDVPISLADFPDIAKT